MKKIIMPVGIPGSGKTTYIKNNFNLTDKSVMRISADSIRYMLYGDENVQGNPIMVFNIVYNLFRLVIQDRTIETIIIDNTNINYNTRKNYYDILKEYSVPYKITLIEFTDHVKAFIRNDARERTVPEDVMVKMQSKYSGLTKEEKEMGIDSIEIVQ